MFKALEDGLADNGGSASIAFNGGGLRDGIRDGKQITCSDRMPWGELQEFLRYIFSDCARIDGRVSNCLTSMLPPFAPFAPLLSLLACSFFRIEELWTRCAGLRYSNPGWWPEGYADYFD